MPPFFSSSVKNSITNTLSFSIRRKSPTIVPALGAVQICSATRGPQSPRQRPSSQEKSERSGLDIASGAAREASAFAATAAPALDREVARVACCAESAGEPAKNAGAAMHANRKKTPLFNRNTLGLPWMQRCDFPTRFTVGFHRFAKVRAIAEKTLSWRYPNAADLRPNSVRCREELARGITLTALGRCTIMEFCDGLMKTIIGIALWAAIGLVAVPPAARVQITAPASSTPAAAKTADVAKNPTSTSASPGEQGARGDVYYYF